MDENGRSVEVPRLQLDTELEKSINAAAAMRKSMRQESLEKIRALHVNLPEDEL
jgi:hypothetical protein